MHSKEHKTVLLRRHFKPCVFCEMILLFKDVQSLEISR